jgi:hypothetical protein
MAIKYSTGCRGKTGNYLLKFYLVGLGGNNFGAVFVQFEHAGNTHCFPFQISPIQRYLVTFYGYGVFLVWIIPAHIDQRKGVAEYFYRRYNIAQRFSFAKVGIKFLRIKALCRCLKSKSGYKNKKYK